MCSDRGLARSIFAPQIVHLRDPACTVAFGSLRHSIFETSLARQLAVPPLHGTFPHSPPNPCPLRSSRCLNLHEGRLRDLAASAEDLAASVSFHVRHRDAQGCSDIPPEHRQNKLSRRAAPPPQFSVRVCSTIARLAMAAAGVAARLEALATVAQVAGAELAAQTAAQLHAQEGGLVGDLLRRQGPAEGGCGKQGGRRGGCADTAARNLQRKPEAIQGRPRPLGSGRKSPRRSLNCLPPASLTPRAAGWGRGSVTQPCPPS